MVNLRDKVFFISGADFFQRQRVIENIKKRILKTSNTPVNNIIFYSKEIDIKDLAKKIFTVSFGKNRIAVFKNCLDLKSAAKDFILNNFKKILSTNYIIFETDKEYSRLQRDRKLISDKFFSNILKKASLIRVSSPRRKLAIEDFMYSIRKNDLSLSLHVLESLFQSDAKERMLGPQIIGILVKKFSYLKGSPDKDRCFKYLWEADRAIKEKGVPTRLVIETLLVKLFDRDRH